MKTQGQYSPVLHKMSIVTSVRLTSDLQYDEYGENEPPIEP